LGNKNCLYLKKNEKKTYLFFKNNGRYIILKNLDKIKIHLFLKGKMDIMMFMTILV
jgi:ribosome biogenesis protein Nip4